MCALPPISTGPKGGAQQGLTSVSGSVSKKPDSGPLLTRAWIVAIAILICSACSQIEDRQEAANGCAPNMLSGIGYRVVDGDTIKLKSQNDEIITVRLDQIDAPEKSQPWGNRSKQQLFALVGNKALCVSGRSHDRYGRLVGEIFVGKTDVNREMVRVGGAWAYRKYLRDQSLLALENEARAAKRGLWTMPLAQTIAPWEYRAAKRNALPAQLLDRAMLPLPERPPPVSSSRKCSSRPACSQIKSCDEAKNWLAMCGSQGLDGDMDGVPCERVCVSP